MKAVILAGGRGTRLAPITFVLPKPLVPVGDMAILEVVIRQLRFHGFTDITLTLGHLAELIQGFFAHHATLARAVNLSYVVEERPTGTAGSIANIPALRASDKPFLVMNGDILTNLDYRALFEAHRASGADLTIATHRKRLNFDLGVLDLEDDRKPEDPAFARPPDSPNETPIAEALADLPDLGRLSMRRVRGYREKPVEVRPVSMGIYVYSPKVLGLIDPGAYLDFPNFVLRVLDNGGNVQAFENDATWLDIGRVEDYQTAQDLFAANPGAFLPDLPAEE